MTVLCNAIDYSSVTGSLSNHSKGKQMKISDFIAQSKGKFITVAFIKKDGTVRNLNGRIGVTKHLKGGVSTVNTDQYLVVYDTVAQGYRSVNKDTIVSVTCEGLTINNNAMVTE
jgi:hypothetical protein